MKKVELVPLKNEEAEAQIVPHNVYNSARKDQPVFSFLPAILFFPNVLRRKHISQIICVHMICEK
jgi:hypothetical protein